MMEHRLANELEQVAARFRKLRMWQLLAAAWFAAAVVGGLLLFISQRSGYVPPLAVPLLLIVACVFAVGSAIAAVLSARQTAWVALKVEAAFPELQACLLTAIEQQPELPGGRFGYLQSSVIRQALAHADRHFWKQRVVPASRLWSAAAMQFATLGLWLIVMGMLATFVARQPSSSDVRAAASGASIGDFGVTIEPGNTEVERGTSLLVLARIAGQLPAESWLVYQSGSDEEIRLSMAKSLDDPVFAARIPSVVEPLHYRVELSAAAARGTFVSPTFYADVFEYPELVRADAELTFPSYTSLKPRLVQDVRTVSVVEGTEVRLSCYLNKHVASAALTQKDQEPLVLAVKPGSEPCYEIKLRAEKSRKLSLLLVDDRGRQNVKEAHISLNVLPNMPPTLKPTFPARDLEVSPLEEIEVRGTAWDDFGLARVGLTYSHAGQPPVDVVLAEKVAGKDRRELAHFVRLEELAAQPDQLLTYHFWAEDHAADGTLRRTLGDMYFAEVRPFEEIFRQGQQPPGGQSQQSQQGGRNAQEAQRLAELQKEIINATWKLVRRETAEQLSPAFAADAELLVQSQGAAIEQATALGQQLQDPESQEHLEDVLQAMGQAAEQLTAAKDGPAAAPLTPALAAEQAAYQALLKLRAREHRVVRSQQQHGQSQSSSSSRQQQQLQQLDLSEDQQRYETERAAEAQPEESEAERETRQVLNRLKELARRQHDLNERVKELQAALQEAETEAEREEIHRQLARLEEEQRKILQDTDELEARMQSPENQERMAAEREQLQQTREQVQRAAEALNEEQLGQATAAGTRAEQQFDELKNEFRRQSSSRFGEEVRELRDAARELAEKQEELANRLAQPPAEEQGAKKLSADDPRDELVQALAEQSQRLQGLEERMKQTIEESEATEPLLAEKLYDAARAAQDQGVGERLDETRESLERGLMEDARQEEEAARRGIGQLQEGIERAAESVLGDDTEALRRARQTLEQLGNELNEEIDRNQPSSEARSEQQGETQSGQSRSEQQDATERNQQGQIPSDRAAAGNEQRQHQEKGKGGDQPGAEQPSDNPSQSQQLASGSRPGESQQPGEQNGSPRGTAQPGGDNRDAAQRGANNRGVNTRGGPRLDDSDDQGGGRRISDTGGDGNAPLTGDQFLDWSDRLRDVEEMVDDPELRSRAAQVRDRARSIRAEFKRHSTEPQWDLVKAEVAEPLGQLRDLVAAELLRRSSEKSLVPLDKDAVPPQFGDRIRRYYERLGSGQASGSDDASPSRGGKAGSDAPGRDSR